MLKELKESVYLANLELVKQNLVIYTWGNVSGIDREKNLVVIKPSGVSYDKMTPEDMVIVDLDGNIIEGKYKPSSDTKTHLEIYKKYPNIGGIVHTHSKWATSWAQSGRNIPIYGTTHADHFNGPIICTRALTAEEVKSDYKKNTGLVIIETIKDKNPLDNPAILCKNHGPFSFGKTPEEAVENSVVLEYISYLAYNTEKLKPEIKKIDKFLLDKHYERKHGNNAYYGQNKGE